MKPTLVLIMGVGILLAMIRLVNAQPMVISTIEREKQPLTQIANRVMTEAYKRMDMTMELQYLPGERAIQTACSGGVDGELFRIKGMEQYFPTLVIVPVAIAETEFVVFTKGKKFHIAGWSSLLPYRVGYMRGVKAVEMNLVKGTFVEPVNTIEQAFRKLDAGRSDVVVESRLSGMITIKKLGLTNFVVLEPPLTTVKIFHYLHIKNKNLVQPLTKVLQQMEKEGVIENIKKDVEQAIQSAE